MSLTNEQVRFFRDHGYLRLQGRFSSDVVVATRQEVIDQSARRVEPLRRNPDGRVTRLSHVYERSAVFRAIIESEVLLAPLESLLGPNVEFFLNRHNHATINFRNAIQRRLHRDNLHWARPLVSAIVYLEEATTSNGCTEVIPGSHLLPYMANSNNGGTWMDEHEVYRALMGQALPVPMAEGGILLLDGTVFHTVGVNGTDGTRISMTLAYTAVDELLGIDELAHRVLMRGRRVYKGG